MNPTAAAAVATYGLITITGQYFDTGVGVTLNGLACGSIAVSGHTGIECAPPTQTTAGTYSPVVTLVAPSTDTGAGKDMAYYGAAARVDDAVAAQRAQLPVMPAPVRGALSRCAALAPCCPSCLQLPLPSAASHASP